MEKIRVIELFGGIGACSKALERLGIDYEIADYVEIDKFAVASFNAMHNANFKPQDITKWNKTIQADLIMHGSPCQDFSVAGKQAGGDEGSGTRSSLMYETLRIVEEVRSKYVIWENVKNILSERHRPNFEAYCRRMKELGYKNFCQVLNAKDYGVPQNRERVFTVSILRTQNEPNPMFVFPESRSLTKRLGDFLEEDIEEKYYLSDKQVGSRKDDLTNTLTSVQKDNMVVEYRTRNKRIIETAEKSHFKQGRIEYLDVYNRTPRADITSTLKAGMDHTQGNIIAADYRIRKLTPKECWRLMGFDDSDFAKAERVNSSTQLYKQAGNSIVVNVLEAIFKNLFD